MGYAKMSEESFENDRFDSWEYYRNLPEEYDEMGSGQSTNQQPNDEPRNAGSRSWPAPGSGDQLQPGQSSAAGMAPRSIR